MLQPGVTDYVIMGLGALSLLIWMFFFIKGLKYNSIFEVLDEKEYPFKELYGMGYAVMETIHYKYKSKRDRKIRQQLEVLYEPKYSDFYLRVIYAQQVTISMAVFVLAFALYGFALDVSIVIVGIAFAALAFYYFGTVTAGKITKRSDQLLNEFSEVVSKLALLINAGMILREAWEEVANGNEGVIYGEMRTAVEDMKNGVAEVDAIYAFGTRCMLPEIKKFTSLLIQGITKGSSELSAMMLTQSKEVWALKKQLVRREGEKAASKLLIPMMVMFVGVLIIVVVPIFGNLGG